MIDTFEHRYRSLAAKDPRFDGWFIVGVTSTGIYCRPSCPARVPKRENVRFYPRRRRPSSPDSARASAVDPTRPPARRSGTRAATWSGGRCA